MAVIALLCAALGIVVAAVASWAFGPWGGLAVLAAAVFAVLIAMESVE